MAYEITSSRPWFDAKLTNSLIAVTADNFETRLAAGASGNVAPPATYTAADISATYVEAEVQAIADALEANNTALRALITALDTRGVITTA